MSLIHLHPIVVHFPITLLIIAFVFLLMEKKEAAYYNFLLGTLFSWFAVGSGLLAHRLAPHNDSIHEIVERHEYLGIAVLVIFTAVSFWLLKNKTTFLNKKLKPLFLSAVVIGVGLLMWGSYLGAALVYQHGVAVISKEVYPEATHNGACCQGGQHHSGQHDGDHQCGRHQQKSEPQQGEPQQGEHQQGEHQHNHP